MRSGFPPRGDTESDLGDSLSDPSPTVELTIFGEIYSTSSVDTRPRCPCLAAGALAAIDHRKPPISQL
jgi:hypothetical protein